MYYPILIALIGIATLLKVGTRCMAFLGFQTFVQDDEISMDYVEEGKQLLNRGSCPIIVLVVIEVHAQ